MLGFVAILVASGLPIGVGYGIDASADNAVGPSDVAGDLVGALGAGTNQDSSGLVVPIEPMVAPPGIAGEVEDDGWISPDELLARLGDVVAGFGGMFYTDDGLSVTIWLTSNVTVSEALRARDIAANVLDDVHLSSLGVIPRKADFTWSQLHEWHMRLFSEPDLDFVFSDIDETINRIVMGVEDPSTQEAALRSVATRLGIAPGAIHFVEAAPAEDDTSLSSSHRPIRGGLQTAWWRTATATSHLCTVGVPARLDSISGFLTASHCSNLIGSTNGVGDNTSYGQPGTNQPVASEHRDGRWWTGTVSGYTCPTDRQCRFADTNFAAYLPGETLRRGRIAWPPSEGSTSWNGSTERTIIGLRYPEVGKTVAMVGRASGRRTGIVRGSCVVLNQTYGPTNVRWVCMAYADYHAQGGDSGGPIFRRESGGTLDAHLQGIHKGRFSIGGTQYSWYSPVSNSRNARELGTGLRVCISTVDC